MGLELRFPNITAQDGASQLAQVKSYLYQLVGQLQYAISELEGTTSNAVVLSQKTSSYVDEVTKPKASFDSIKSLIIKSADIVQAYYEEINKRLVGEYMAQSDFGVFTEQTEQAITENSTEIKRLFTNIQEIVTDIESLEFTLVEVNAHIKSGLLYEDEGVPVYGLEIGQKNIIDGEEVFNKFARFTSDRLSFYDQNGNEVAYISDYKLYIRNVQITGSYRIGGFVDTVQSNGDVVERWVGGNG